MITKQHILLVFSALALFSMSLLIVFGDKGYADYKMLKKARQSLAEKNRTLVRENAALYRSMERLKHDPEYIENIARKELGVVGKNEIIFKFERNRLYKE